VFLRVGPVWDEQFLQRVRAKQRHDSIAAFDPLNTADVSDARQTHARQLPGVGGGPRTPHRQWVTRGLAPVLARETAPSLLCGHE
jgi:hypothetical protein